MGKNIWISPRVNRRAADAAQIGRRGEEIADLGGEAQEHHHHSNSEKKTKGRRPPHQSPAQREPCLLHADPHRGTEEKPGEDHHRASNELTSAAGNSMREDWGMEEKN